MSDYRINVRFHADIPAEKKAAEYLQTLNKSRNKFIVDAVIAYMNKESADNETLLESIRQIFREEVQTVAVVSHQKMQNVCPRRVCLLIPNVILQGSIRQGLY